jgi:hypothetical protein
VKVPVLYDQDASTVEVSPNPSWWSWVIALAILAVFAIPVAIIKHNRTWEDKTPTTCTQDEYLDLLADAYGIYPAQWHPNLISWYHLICIDGEARLQSIT